MFYPEAKETSLLMNVDYVDEQKAYVNRSCVNYFALFHVIYYYIERNTSVRPLNTINIEIPIVWIADLRAVFFVSGSPEDSWCL